MTDPTPLRPYTPTACPRVVSAARELLRMAESGEMSALAYTARLDQARVQVRSAGDWGNAAEQVGGVYLLLQHVSMECVMMGDVPEPPPEEETP